MCVVLIKKQNFFFIIGEKMKFYKIDNWLSEIEKKKKQEEMERDAEWWLNRIKEKSKDWS